MRYTAEQVRSRGAGLDPEIRGMLAAFAATLEARERGDRLYEELRAEIDDGSESMTHADALKWVQDRVASEQTNMEHLMNNYTAEQVREMAIDANDYGIDADVPDALFKYAAMLEARESAESVGTLTIDKNGDVQTWRVDRCAARLPLGVHKLYTHPPQAASVPDEVALKLARACLWSAFAWNDHNFGDKRADLFDREAAAKVGITTLERANEWLDKQERSLAAAPPPPAQAADAIDAAIKEQAK